MILIPVIDLKQGTVVHARAGRREDYRPVRSRLAVGAEPLQIIEAFLRLHPFRTVYAADLDAITGEGDNDAALRAIRAAFPEVDLWVDRGFVGAAGVAAWLGKDLGRPVIGSESLADMDAWRAVRETAGSGAVLSLDFRGGRFLGPAGLLESARSWPERVIVMALARVGGRAGPDLARISAVLRRAQGRRIFAAGGVRNIRDLVRLEGMGVAGALVASALHDRRIGRAALARFGSGAATPSRAAAAVSRSRHRE